VQGNSANGIALSSVTTTTVGGSQNTVPNGIWQNHMNGVLVGTGAASITIQGNGIGIGFLSDGTPANLGNVMDAVSISASGNLVGGATADLGNNIAFNGGDGVAVMSGNANGILSNVISVSTTSDLPIHLSPGTNDGIVPPTISAATVSAAPSSSAAGVSVKRSDVTTQSSTIMVISFAFSSSPHQTFNMQFYVPQICNCTNCFADVGIYSTQVTTDAGGNAPSPISIALTAQPAPNSFVNATATNVNDSTSQFAECVQVGSSSACDYQLSSSSGNVSAAGGASSFGVMTQSTCAYSAADPDSFVHITSGAGIGNGTVSFTVDANASTSSRQSTITVAPGVAFTVNQDGVGPDFIISLASSSVSGSPGQVVPVTVNIERSGGFTGPVTITPPAKSNGIKPKPNTSKKLKNPNSSYSLNMKITSTAVPGTYQFTFTGTNSTLGTRTAILSVTVN
ncbi:MAG TPA: BACON domain-containing protein, partial [Blastocatellia bacterium]|nr:BACON domain-containing protein [Blastocatellia bacterium]